MEETSEFNYVDFNSFVESIQERRMTREGRFIRVFTTGGANFDLVPPGSLGSGIELVTKDKAGVSWRFVEPPVDVLWKNHRGN
ncbi:hypothetical protein C2E31_10945 [Rhodopirellula baltica]|nr:hypothetical protein C2E31_10945 [Rhodopirellula baltica]